MTGVKFVRPFSLRDRARRWWGSEGPEHLIVGFLVAVLVLAVGRLTGCVAL
mgnify:FL=1